MSGRAPFSQFGLTGAIDKAAVAGDAVCAVRTIGPFEGNPANSLQPWWSGPARPIPRLQRAARKRTIPTSEEGGLRKFAFATPNNGVAPEADFALVRDAVAKCPSGSASETEPKQLAPRVRLRRTEGRSPTPTPCAELPKSFRAWPAHTKARPHATALPPIHPRGLPHVRHPSDPLTAARAALQNPLAARRRPVLRSEGPSPSRAS